MSSWLEHTLAPLIATSNGLAILLDPDEVSTPSDLRTESAEVGDWWALRKTYELVGRRRQTDAGRFALVVRGPLAAEPLPWDVEKASAATISARLPGPPEVRRVLAELVGDEADRAIQATERAADRVAGLIGCLTGVAVTAAPLSRADQLRLAARLALRERRAPQLFSLAKRWVVDPVVAGLLDDPANAKALQGEWASFAGSGQSCWASDFDAARNEIGQLFAVGLLTPVLASSEVPPWALVGVRKPTNDERAEELLAEPPGLFPPSTAVAWAAFGQWWGDLRRLVAVAPPDLRARAWEAWGGIDAAFLPWLRGSYGEVLSSAARWPAAVHRVAPFLARRLSDGTADRVLLVVLDGLGHAQWAHLRERFAFQVHEAGSTFALVPTYTTVSRQAIFAADLPITYPDSLWSTQPERRRWEAFWTGTGLPVTAVAYHRVKGRFPHDHVNFGAARAIGVVVNAVDDLMHTSELFGDAQLLANLDVWVANGFLDDLVQRASASGIEVWVTADHGNMECLPAGAPTEGVAIESAGKRLLRYPNRVLRDASTAEGIAWDDIPGMPSSAEPLLFAAGRLAFTNNRISISHGGLSIDEVIVPFARVSA